MEKREIDNCHHFDIETGCTKDFCTCEIVEDKQETIEEVVERLYPDGCDGTDKSAEIYRRIFVEATKWKSENIPIHILDVYNVHAYIKDGAVFIEKNDKDKVTYTEEEIINMFDKFNMHLPLHYEFLVKEQFKKR